MTGSTPSTHIARVAAPLRLEVILQIRTAIATGEYAPGQRLVERELCERYAVSRTVVREALRHLEAEGLVTIVPNRGPVVTVLSLDDAAALFEMRASLEAIAVSWFADRASESERAELLKACDLIEVALDSGELTNWLPAKDHYYDVVLTGAHSDPIRAMVLALHARVQVLRALSLKEVNRRSESLAEVRVIAGLAVEGRAAEASILAKAHVDAAARAAFTQMGR